MNEAVIGDILPFLNTNSLWLLMKGLFVVGFLIYVVFSLVVVSQIMQMTKTLNGSLDLPLKTLGWIHVGVAAGALVLALIVL